MLSGITLVSLLSILGSADCEVGLSGKILELDSREPIADVEIESAIKDTPW